MLTFVLFFTVKPLSAQIITSVQPLSADRKYEIVCQSLGSRPRAHITWWKDNRKLNQCTEKVRYMYTKLSNTFLLLFSCKYKLIYFILL